MGKRVTDLVKIIIDRKKDIQIAADMTAGKGNDSKYILDNTNVLKLYAFDIQEDAKKLTTDLIGDDDRFFFILDSHEYVGKYIKEDLDLAIYNLGYLPGGNKEITTSYESTIRSIEKTLNLMKPGGALILTIYPGHPAGKIESEEVESYLEGLDSKKYPIIKISYQNRPNNPPYIILIEKN